MNCRPGPHIMPFLFPDYIGTCYIQCYSSLSMRERNHTRCHMCGVFVAYRSLSDRRHPGSQICSASWDSKSCGRHSILLVDNTPLNRTDTKKMKGFIMLLCRVAAQNILPIHRYSVISFFFFFLFFFFTFCGPLGLHGSTLL